MPLIALFLSFTFLFSCSQKSSDGISLNGIRQAELIEGKRRGDYEAFAHNYMIATQGGATTMAAKYALDLGGNIFDAATAASFAISVERPHSTGLGGGGFMLIRHAKTGKVQALDFRETAPAKAFKEMFMQNGKQDRQRSLTGAKASATPGLVAGVLKAHEKYGKLSLAQVMKPAIELAKKGFSIYPALETAIAKEAHRLCRYKDSAKIFLNKNCAPKKAGQILVQTDLARTLELIAKKGRKGFYEGRVAKNIVATQRELKGLMSMDDLKGYRVKDRTPVVGEYRDHKIYSMPPPSSGGTHIIQILNLLEAFKLKEKGAQSATAVHLTATAMQMAFADRALYMGDSDFASIPVNKLISKQYAAQLRQKMSERKAIKSKALGVSGDSASEPDHTTHFTLMDREGNIVTSTQTINGWFGSAVVAQGTGVVMNNEMDDFASHVGGVNLFGAIGGKNNLVEPFKRPLSSMSPTIVERPDGTPYLALGTPSGTRILTCVLQTVLNVLEYEMPLWEAVSATRFHHQWHPEELWVERPYLTPATENQLKKIGHKIAHKDLGCKIQAVMRHKDGRLHGVSDPREEGMSFGE